jgi:oligopeptide transport system substrate-binding protein
MPIDRLRIIKKALAPSGMGALLYGCSLIFPPATLTLPATPAPSPTLTPTPISAKAFLQSVAAEAVNYPLRYYSPEGAISLEVPPGWVFNQKKDSGEEVDAISETYGGDVIAAIYHPEPSSKETTAQQATVSFFKSDWVTARQMEIGSQMEFAFDSGDPGWRADGTLVPDPGKGIRVDCIFIVSAHRNLTYVLVAYPSRAKDPASFRADFEKMARSLRWEETNTMEFDKSDALQLWSAEPDTLDPALTHAETDGAIGDIYSGLVVMDRSLKVQPALAERWDVTPDGKTYTFHLKKNVQFQNGRPVNAGDVIFSWLRAAGPELNSDTALLSLGDIAGMKEYHEGKTDNVPGIRWIDAGTIQVTIVDPVSTFPEKLTSPAASVVDRYDVRLPHWELHPNGTGPFRMVQRVPERSILLEPNSNYYDSIPKLKYLMYWISSSPQETLYKNNKLDQMQTTGALLPQILDPHDPLFGNVFIQQRLCTNFITLNNSAPPFDDPLIRKAFELAINRSIYTEVTAALGDLPGYGILPPGMPGYSAEWKPVMFDLETAKQLLHQSRYFNGSGLSTDIQLILPTDGLEYSPTMEYLIDSWKNNLGIKISVEGLPAETYRARLKAGDYGPAMMDSQCANFPDPENFYSFLLRSDSTQNQSHYRNEQMDSLLESARIEPDWSKRIANYRTADQMIYDDAPIIILSYSGPEYIIWKPFVMGFVPTFAGVPQHQFLWINR